MAKKETTRKKTYRETDSVWKDLLNRYLTEFMSFFFPKTYQIINWEREFEFLDTELPKLSPQSQVGKRLADKLVKAYRVEEEEGKETWLFIHIEIQSYPDPHFEERMCIYHYRIFDRYYERLRQKASESDNPEPVTQHKTSSDNTTEPVTQDKSDKGDLVKPVPPLPKYKVLHLVVLTGVSETYNPSQYEVTEVDGNKSLLKYPIVKLIDYNKDWAKLERAVNPFTLVVMAHLKAQELKDDPYQLLEWKVRLVEILYQRKYPKEQVRQLLRFIDWIMVLPKEMEPIAQERLALLEEEKMAYVTSFERLGIEKGIEKGLEKGRKVASDIVLRQLRQKFGSTLLPEAEQQVSTLTLEQLDALSDLSWSFPTTTELENWLRLQKG
ncbi:MAG: DUF4351 domain-containing protein [Chloroflexi bacterium]|nr:DUF4351 domain-containing protein [Chloroflexota bacterium]